VLGAPELDARLQEGSHQSGAEGQNPLPRPAGHTAFGAAQEEMRKDRNRKATLSRPELKFPK